MRGRKRKKKKSYCREMRLIKHLLHHSINGFFSSYLFTSYGPVYTLVYHNQLKYLNYWHRNGWTGKNNILMDKEVILSVGTNCFLYYLANNWWHRNNNFTIEIYLVSFLRQLNVFIARIFSVFSLLKGVEWHYSSVCRIVYF